MKNKVGKTIVILLQVILLGSVSNKLYGQRRDKVSKDSARKEVTAWPDQHKRYALLIGVNNYEDSQITPLIGAVNDMVMLEDALVKYGGFDRDRIIRLTESANDLQVKSTRPTYRNIYTRLSNILKIVPSDGLLLLAFSGHGIERNGRAFLLPTDASVNGDIQLLERTALDVASIKEMIENRKDENGRQVGINQVVVLLDACRSDPTSGKDLSTNPLTKAYDFSLKNSNVQAYATIYATSRGERAYENPEKRQGYFIAEVVAGLSGRAANEQGEVTLARLISYIEDKVPTRVTLDLGQTQRPFMELQGYKAAELIITVNSKVKSTRTNEPKVETKLETKIETETIAELTPTPLIPLVPLPVSVMPTALSVLNITTAHVSSEGIIERYEGEPSQQYAEDLGSGVTLEMVAIKGDEINQSFWIGKYEVTQAQWKAVMGYNPSYFKGDQLPVDSVSWQEVKDYCSKLNVKLGLTQSNGYKLPTEAEWEYAARAGMKSDFAFGSTITSTIVNYDGNHSFGNVPVGRYRQRTINVGALGVANKWGVYDMHGNVWEWCENAEGLRRAIRGGGWNDTALGCRLTRRSWSPNTYRGLDLGFRLLRPAR